jgi:hypothetical protein
MAANNTTAHNENLNVLRMTGDVSHQHARRCRARIASRAGSEV